MTVPVKPLKPRFTIRAMLLLMVLVAAPLAFHGYHLSWIRQRHSAIESGQVDVFSTSHQKVSVPFPLTWYGEAGYHKVYAATPTADRKQETRRRLASLFPEAEIYIDIAASPESVSSRTP